MDRLFTAVFNLWSDAAIVTDHRYRIVAANAAFQRASGRALGELLGHPAHQFVSHRMPRTTLLDLRRALEMYGSWQGEIEWCRQDGSLMPGHVDIQAVRNDERRIVRHIIRVMPMAGTAATPGNDAARASWSDPLTGLPSRSGLLAQLAQALAGADRDGTTAALLVMDLDHFKIVNDTLGHAAGDALLAAVAQRLLTLAHEDVVVARLGGDEFCIVLNDAGDADTAAWTAHRFLSIVDGIYHIEGADLHTSASVGLAVYPDHAGDGATLLRNAEAAMYQAKGQGRNNVQLYTPELHQSVSQRLHLDHALRIACDRQQFELHYQPQIDCRSGHIVGVEALMRWRGADGKMVPPTTFIPQAEESGLILRMGSWVLDEACRQLAAWHAAGLDHLSMAVNLSAYQLRSSQLLTHVVLTLDRYGLDGANLEIEITESVAMHNPETSIGKLRALRDLGVRLAIDDFGTGYSSLSYLKQLPIHALKLDRSFVRDIETDANNVAICTATIGLAHNLGLTVVAEGVETQAQHDFLVQHRCDLLQGYLFCRPLPAAEAFAFIQKHCVAPSAA